jgi:MOSC domain-containing protein YiiM
MNVDVLAFLAGRVQPFARGQSSAIAKSVVDGPVEIGFLGLDGDAQADLSVHGGPDKALHHYPFDHYARWSALAAEHPRLNAPGSFGENISTFGWTDADVCIGDRFRVGSAVLEVSQGRQPCWKQGVRMEWTTLPNLMVRERRCGWYYRVLEKGRAQAGDTMSLVDRPYAGWTVERVFGLLIAGDHKSDPAAVQTLAQMSVLFEGWRHRAQQLCETL